MTAGGRVFFLRESYNKTAVFYNFAKIIKQTNIFYLQFQPNMR